MSIVASAFDPAVLAAELRAAGLTCVPGARLADYTTFRLGGPCPLLVDCASADQLRRAVATLHAANADFLLIGGGSNLLVADEGLDRVVLRYVEPTPVIRREGAQLVVSGGTALDALAAFAVTAGLAGLENCSGVPGTVAGAVVGNAGAYGWQLGDIVECVRALDRTGRERDLPAAELDFRYRHSRLKTSGDLVLAVTLRPLPGDPVAAAARRAEILADRAVKHPHLDTDPCAGSFFRNLEPSSKAERRQAAGRVLEAAGAKALRVGGACVFPRHANIIIKGGPACRAQDVFDLSLQMAAAVRAQSGHCLVREVRLLGRFRQPDGGVLDMSDRDT